MISAYTHLLGWQKTFSSQESSYYMLLPGGDIDVVDIEICQRPDGSDWLLGAGASAKVLLDGLWSRLAHCLKVAVCLYSVCSSNSTSFIHYLRALACVLL